MPKRNFPFDGTSPLQLKTHINAFYFEKLNDMDKIYGKFGPWQCRLRNAIKSVEVIILLVFFYFLRLKFKLLMLKSYRERCKIVSQAEFLPVRDIFVLGIS